MKGILPEGKHVLTAQEFIKRTCTSTRRIDLYNNSLKPVCQFLLSKDLYRILVTGEYMEEIEDPRSIEILIPIVKDDFMYVFEDDETFDNFQAKQTKEYNCKPWYYIKEDEGMQQLYIGSFGRCSGCSDGEHERGFACVDTDDIVKGEAT